MKKMRRTCLALTVSIASLLAVQSVRAQVMSQVPSAAQVVIRVKNLQAFSGKISAFVKDIGVADQVPPDMAGDPLGFMLAQGKITQGLNKDSDAAIVFMNLTTMSTPTPAMVLLLPVTDYDGFLKNFTNVTPSGAVSSLTMNGDTTPSYAAKWGNYAAISPVKELVSTPPTAMAAPSAAMTAELEKDLVIWTNMKAVRELVLPQLDPAQQMAIQQVDQNMAAGSPMAKYASVAKIGVNQAFRIARGLFQQCDAATFSMNLDGSGISLGGIADFQPDSYFGKVVAQAPHGDKSLFAGLPDAKYMFVGAFAADPKLVSQLASDALDPVKAELANNPDAKGVNDYIQAMEDTMAATKGNAVGWIVPTAELGTAPIMQMVGVIHGDAKTIIDAQHRGFNSTKGLMDATGNAMVKQTYTPAGKTIAGVTFDQMHTSFDAAGATTPQQQQASMFMPYLYGPDGVNTYVGQVDAQTVLVTAGAPDELMTQAVAAAKTGDAAVSQQPGIASTASHLAKTPFAEAFLPLDTILNTVAGYVGKMGIPINVTVPATDPIGMEMHADGSTIVHNTYIPTKLITGIITAAKQVMPKAAPAAAPAPAPGGAL